MIKKEMDNNFFDLIKRLNEEKAPYWCMNGTLLGLARDGELIEWDGDIDIAFEINTVNISRILNIFHELDFNGGVHRRRRPGLPVLKFKRKGGRNVEILFFSPTQRKNEKIVCLEWFKTDSPLARLQMSNTQLNVLKILQYIGRLPIQEQQLGIKPLKIQKSLTLKLIAYMSRLFPSTIREIENWLSVKYELDEVMGYYFPYTCLGKGTHLEYGPLKCRVASDYKSVCEHIYGKSWTKPKKSTHWTDFMQG